MPDFTLRVLSNTQVDTNIEAIAHLRIDIFREYPYLYDGHLEYEAGYLKKFARTQESIIVIAEENRRIIGAMTGLPLRFEIESIKQPWLDHRIDIEKVYYFSEVLIYPQYRGKGLGRKLFELAEKTVTAFHTYDTLSLATVIRDNHHPQKPNNYKELDDFWSQNGYTRQDNLICHLAWQEVDENKESDKPLIFWVKKLSASSENL